MSRVPGRLRRLLQMKLPHAHLRRDLRAMPLRTIASTVTALTLEQRAEAKASLGPRVW